MTPPQQTKNNEPRIYVVDDNEDIRNLIASALKRESYSVELFVSGEALLEVDRFSSEGCLLLDNHLPGRDGLNVQELLNQKPGFDLPIIFISGASGIRDVVLAMQNGAFSFLEKPFTLEELFNSVDKAINRSGEQARKRELQVNLATLTLREKDVYNLTMKGFSIKDIAQELDISESTVEFHRHNILKKTRCDTLPKLMAKVIEYGILA